MGWAGRRELPSLIAALILLSCVCWIVFSPDPFSLSSSVLEGFGEFRSIKIPKLSVNPFTGISGSGSLPLLLPQGISLDYDGESWCDNGTLGVANKIFVVSLPRRVDRREDMEKLRHSIALNWTYIDATSPDDPVIDAILKQVRRSRDELTLRPGPSSSQPRFKWPSELSDDAGGSVGLRGSDLWTAPFASAADTNSNNTLAVSHVQELAEESSTLGDPSVSLEPLTCATENYTTGPLYAASLPMPLRLTPAKIACWYSHLQVIRRIAAGVGSDLKNEAICDDVGIVLEDDVDMEKDIRDRLRSIWSALPLQWDIVFLGHCWSNESHYPALATTVLPLGQTQTSLHPSFAPKCTHAYALSRAGALKIVNHLRFPPFAYSRALDQALAWMVLSGRLKSFSVVPSVIIQRKVARSDVDEGREGLGSDWRDTLVNGVLGT